MLTRNERDDRPLPTYYDRPAVKPVPWDWKVPAYVFVAGIAGASQILATLASWRHGRSADSIVRNGHYLGLGGSIIGAILLIADLHTPQRFYNMLRIFRATSPMSIGTYILSFFGLFSGLGVFGQMLADWTGARGLGRRLMRVAQLPAALSGAGMSSYTGTLLSATSTPLWAAAPKLLSARFACSSMASGAAALSLADQFTTDGRNGADLDRVACVATAADLAVSLVNDERYRQEGVEAPLEEDHSARYKAGALLLGHGVPLACYAVNAISGRHSRSLSILAAASVLTGSYLTRAAIIEGGMASAERAHDYLQFTHRKRRAPWRIGWWG